MKKQFSILFTVLLLAALVPPANSTDKKSPGDKEELTAVEIMTRSQQAYYYAGTDGRGRITMQLIDKNGNIRLRKMTMLRRNVSDNGDQKFFIYFHEPGDVRRMTFMVWKYPEKDDDRWMYIPSIDLIRRIAANDKRSSFVGSDFTYEDISGRDVSSDKHTLLGREKIGVRDCYKIESVPKDDAEYIRRVSWIDKETFLPIQEEYYDAQNERFKVFKAGNIENIKSGEDIFPTIVSRTMENIKTGHRTEVTLEDITYNTGLKDDDFSERRMRRPPRNWIR